MPPRVVDQRKAQLLELARDGMAWNAIAKTLRMCPHTVRRHCRAANLTPPPKASMATRLAAKMVATGQARSYRAAAKAFGIDPETVHSYCTSRGIWSEMTIRRRELKTKA